MAPARQTKLVYASLGAGCLALVLAVRQAFQGPDVVASAPAASACVDPEARAQIESLRSALAERDTRIVDGNATARRTPATRDPTEPAPASASSPIAAAPAAAGPKFYKSFAIPNAAVTVKQKADGTYDIRSTDPALAGTVMEIVAVTAAGEEERLLIRIPP